MRAAAVPGMAVAVVRDGDVVAARGYGVRDSRTVEPVDANTLFAIGSMTKSFTAAGLALLVADGRLGWEDRLTDHLPTFRVADPWVTRHLTLLDVLTHRSGLEPANLLWYTLDLGPDSLMARLAHLEQAGDFRDAYAYNNLGYFIAGRVLESVSGRSWAEFVEDRLLEPLGMSRTVMTVAEADTRPNTASHHILEDDTLRVIQSRDYPAAPAGGMLASVRDLGRWLAWHLGEGTVSEERLLDTAVTHSMHSGRVVIPRRAPARNGPDVRFLSYGLGWRVWVYRGERVVGHAGAVDGMRSQMLFLPDRDIGIAVVTNVRGRSLSTAIAYRVVDAFLGGEPRDWAASFLERDRALERSLQQSAAETADARVADTQPSLPLDAYAGTYEDPLWGRLVITRTPKGLEARFGRLRGQVQHWHVDAFRIHWDDPVLPESLVTFRMDHRARIHEAVLEQAGTFTRRTEG